MNNRLTLVDPPTPEETRSWYDNPTMVCGICFKELPLEDFSHGHDAEHVGIICCPCWHTDSEESTRS